ncbi:MAG: NADH-quinone oxidoreductase subunit D [bacterium]
MTLDLDLKSLGFRVEGRRTIESGGDELLVNMGPQHPSTHGVLRLLLRTDGEEVQEAVPSIGYLHRCAEKIGENVTYDAYTLYTDRLDYLAAMNNNWTWAMAVEKLAGIEVPERAEYIRIIVAELNRIASHLVMVGTYGIDMGAFTPFLLTFREREEILDLLEEISGARLCYGYVRIGGVSDDITPTFASSCKRFLDQYVAKLDAINELLSFNQIFVRRTANVGVLSPEKAVSYGCTGPILRATGVDWDLRRDEPYSIYDRFDWKVCVGKGDKGQVGDTWDRYMVRIREMYESVRICQQALEGIPEGLFRTKMPRKFKPPAGECYFRAENPRGELAFYIISDGTDTPRRVKVRGPSFCNLSVIQELTRNLLVSDVVAVLGSFDLVMGEVDR